MNKSLRGGDRWAARGQLNLWLTIEILSYSDRIIVIIIIIRWNPWRARKMSWQKKSCNRNNLLLHRQTSDDPATSSVQRHAPLTATIRNCTMSPANWVSKLLVSLLILVNLLELKVAGKEKRCYSCRSRGSLGDCKDPFNVNFTSAGSDGQWGTKQPIQSVPCASGWCLKMIEDDFGDSIAATDRSCMTRPPTDNEERCSETQIENHRDRKAFLCMCHGDLCNSANTIVSQCAIYIMTILTLTTTLIIQHH